MNDNDILSFINGLTEPAGNPALPDIADDIAAIAAESLGWIPLDSGAYLHLGATAAGDAPLVIDVVGSISADMAGSNVLLLT
ncbi:hypothetical protein Ajs_0560 [Acidovorax sp. JS42]|nr:hypothetical protein Ajs_0560 [Acidovorax sp. JS42]